MRLQWGTLGLAVLIGVLSAAGGSWVARQSHRPHENLHDLVHSQFKLTATETARLEAAESRYGQRREKIESDIHAANGRLAEAIQHDPELSKEALAETAQVERSAAELQRVTLQHIFEMRSGLEPTHRAAYDAVLVNALTHDQ